MTFRFNPFTDKLDCIGPQPSGSTVTSVTGTANQILAMPTTGNVVLSLIGPYTPATYPAHSVLVGEGTSSIVGVGPTATAGQILQSAGSSADPAFSTATYPSTTTANQILYSSANNTVTGLATGNNGVLVTSSGGVPSISSTLPTAVTNNITTLGTITAGTWNGGVITGQYGGTGVANTGLTINLASGGSGKVLTSDSSGNATWASPATSGTVTSVSVVSANGFAGTVNTPTTTPAITLSTTATGLLSGNGTAITGTAITQYNVLTAGASNAPNSVAPSSTSGVPLISQGSSSQPVFGTAVVAGGGTGDTSFTAYSVICGGTTSTGALQNVSGVGTSGQVLTSNGASALPTWQAAASGGISTINGDSGSITGSTVSITAGNSSNYCGSTVQFVSSGTASILEFTNSGLGNTMLGALCGNTSMSGHNNDGHGTSVLNALTTGGGNCVMGGLSGQYITTGSSNTSFGYSSFSTSPFNGGFNTGLGHGVGQNYTSSESSNILIGYGVAGTVGESNVLRIGSGNGTGSGQISKTFIAGIEGVSVSNMNVVTINTSTNQMGSQASNTIGSWVFIQQQTASNSASLSFTSGISTTYNNYILVVSNYIPATTSTNLILQISTNGGSSYINSGYASGLNYSTYNSTTQTNANITSGFLLSQAITSVALNGTYQLLSFTANLSTSRPSIAGALGGRIAGNIGFGLVGGEYTSGSTAVNAFQISSSSGNLSSGTFTLYGILE